jgi:sugar/nucleoside kinase (ribokinase family)
MRRGAGAAVMKLSSRGCAIFTAGEEIRVPAFDVDCVDTTGAGDSFVAGFLSVLLRGGSLEEAGRLGNAVGALVVRQVGAVTGVRTLEATLEWMREARIRP